MFHVSSKDDTMFASFCSGLMAVSQKLGMGAGVRATYPTGQARISPSQGWSVVQRQWLVDRPHPASYFPSDCLTLRNWKITETSPLKVLELSLRNVSISVLGLS